MFSPVWSKTGHSLLATIRWPDNKDQWLLSFDPETAAKRVVNHEHDDAWVLNDDDAPSLSLLEYGFLEEGRKVWFMSEHTGFRHLYAGLMEGGEPQALTAGNYELWHVKLSRDETFYFCSNQDGPEVMHFYALPARGGIALKLTSDVGNHQVTMSPDDTFLADVCSFSNKPWELHVQPLQAPSQRLALTDSSTSAFKSYP